MTPANSGRSHPSPGPDPMALDRLVGIGRAGRYVAALPSDQRGDTQLIEADGEMRRAAPGGHSERPYVGLCGMDALAPHHNAAILPTLKNPYSSR